MGIISEIIGIWFRWKDRKDRKKRDAIPPRVHLEMGPHIRSGSKIKPLLRFRNRSQEPVTLIEVFITFFHEDELDSFHSEKIPIVVYSNPLGDDKRELQYFDYKRFPEFSNIRDLAGKAYYTYYCEFEDSKGRRHRWPVGREERKDIKN